MPVSANQTPAKPVSTDPDTKLPESQTKEDKRGAETCKTSLIDEGSSDEEGLQSDESQPDQSVSAMKGKQVSLGLSGTAFCRTFYSLVSVQINFYL